MNRRATSCLLFLLYAMGSLLFGVLPHEHHGEHHGTATDGNCAACVWQVNSATDEPAPTVTISFHAVILAHEPVPADAPRLFWFAPSTLERAPPETLA